jgi:hypothetical protein
VPAEVVRQFAAVEALPALPEIAARWRGKVVRRYYLYACRRLLQECGAAARAPLLTQD